MIWCDKRRECKNYTREQIGYNVYYCKECEHNQALKFNHFRKNVKEGK